MSDKIDHLGDDLGTLVPAPAPVVEPPAVPGPDTVDGAQFLIVVEAIPGESPRALRVLTAIEGKEVEAHVASFDWPADYKTTVGAMLSFRAGDGNLSAPSPRKVQLLLNEDV